MAEGDGAQVIGDIPLAEPRRVFAWQFDALRQGNDELTPEFLAVAKPLLQ